jgi:hypothetical protein
LHILINNDPSNYVGSADGTNWKNHTGGYLACEKVNEGRLDAYAKISDESGDTWHGIYAAADLVIPEKIRFNDGTIAIKRNW